MPLISATIQQQMAAAIEAALDSQLPDGIKADPTAHQKMAAAIAQGVTTVIVTALLTEAVVAPGQSVVGTGPTGPIAGTTVSPGKLM